MSNQDYETRDVMVNSNMIKAVKIAYNLFVSQANNAKRSDFTRTHAARQSKRLWQLLEAYENADILCDGEIGFRFRR